MRIFGHIYGNHLHAHNWHFMNFKANKELKQFYVSIVMRTFALSMIALFIPIYLIKEANLGLEHVLLFYVISVSAYILSAFLGAFFCSKLGARHIMILMQPFYILLYVLIYLMKFKPSLLVNVAILSGIVDGFFWLSYHSIFANSTDKAHRSEEISIGNVLMILIGILGPVIGGLLINYLGFLSLFVLVGILLMLSALPLYRAKDLSDGFKFKINDVFNRKHFRDFLGFFGYGLFGIGEAILWPLFLFLVLVNYVAIGGLVSLSGILRAVVSYATGKAGDKIGRRVFVNAGGVLNSLSWFIRPFFSTSMGVMIVTLYSGLTSMLFEGPFTALVYDRANYHNHRLEYLAFRQIALGLGQLLILVVVYYTLSYKLGFILAGIGSLMITLF